MEPPEGKQPDQRERYTCWVANDEAARAVPAATSELDCMRWKVKPIHHTRHVLFLPTGVLFEIARLAQPNQVLELGVLGEATPASLEWEGGGAAAGRALPARRPPASLDVPVAADVGDDAVAIGLRGTEGPSGALAGEGAGSAAATSGDDVVAFVAWGPLWVVLGVDLGCLGAMLVVLLLPDLLLLCKLSLSSGASTATSAEGLEEFSWSFVVVASSPSSAQHRARDRQTCLIKLETPASKTDCLEHPRGVSQATSQVKNRYTRY
eukprot:1137879-Pelagomonas_calceolata.AAC.2